MLDGCYCQKLYVTKKQNVGFLIRSGALICWTER